jgi:hypothetical protein
MLVVETIAKIRRAYFSLGKPIKGRCHVWTTPADQGFFCRVAMVVGAVMSPAWLCGIR